MKEQNPRKRTKRNRDSQPIRCRVQNTGDQDAQRTHEYNYKIKEEMKATRSEIQKNLQGTNSEGKEAGIQTNNLEQKEEINIQPDQKEETRIQKMRRGLGTSGTTTSNVPMSESQGCQKEKRKSKKTSLKK